MKEFLSNFKSLDTTHKNLVYFMWFYLISTSAGGIFINIFIYNNFNSIAGIVLHNIINFLFCLIGFFAISIINSKLNKSFRNNFAIGLCFYIISIISLIFLPKGQNLSLLIFSTLYGLGGGTFWSGVHTYELGYIKKELRDFYSSSISLGGQIIKIIFPLLIAGIFLLTTNFIKIDGYLILFIILICTLLTSLLFLKNLPDYKAKTTSLKQVLNKFKIEEIYQNLYFIIYALGFALGGMLLNICMVHILNTEIKIGFFQAIVGIFSVLITMLLSTKRNEKNRFKIMLIFAFLIFLNFTFFGFNITVIGLIIFRLLDLIFIPGFDISAIVYTMKYMSDKTKDDEDFLPKVLFRELLINIGRLIVLPIFYIVYTYSNINTNTLLKYSLILSGLFFILSCLFVYLEEKRLKKI